MNNRTLGTLGMADAPFLLLFPTLPTYFSGLKGTAIDGIFGKVYLLAWMCSIGCRGHEARQ